MTTHTQKDDLDAYRRQCRAWLASNAPARRDGADARSVSEKSDTARAAERDAQRRQYEAGYVGIDVPVKYGGQGLSERHQQIWLEESSSYVTPAPGGVASHVTLGIIMPTLLAFGDEGQKRDWIPRMLSGEEIWAQLLSEPAAGSDLAGVITRATRDRQTWILNGSKIWSSGAMAADFGICLARTDWDAPKHRGLTWFKVPLHNQHVTVRPIREINGSAEFCEEFIEDLPVSDDMVIGKVNDGWRVARAMLSFERRGGATSRARGSARPVHTSLAPDLIRLARQFNSVDDPAIRQLIARAHINDFMQRELTAQVTEQIRQGASPARASLIKLGVGVIDPLRAAAGMEIAGVAATAWDDHHDTGAQSAAISFLNGRIYSIAGGSNQIQRNIISEQLLELPRELSVDSDRPFREVRSAARANGRRDQPL